MLGRIAFAFGVAVSLELPAVGQVVVDGDLRDLESVAQCIVQDSVNEVCPLGKSGFDFERVLVYYDAPADALYLGLDLMDVEEESASGYDAIGIPGPGVPGDADGNNDPDTSTNLACVAAPFRDEPGVGPDEAYCFLVDPMGRGDSSESICISYRDNALSVHHSLVGDPIPGLSATIALGTVGCLRHPTTIPHENPSTADIEVRVDDWSTWVPDPARFTLFAVTFGRFGLPGDASVRIDFDATRPPACADGTVNSRHGVAVRVLRVNGRVGGVSDGDHVVLAELREPLEFSLDVGPSGPARPRFVMWAWLGHPTNSTELTARGSRLGCTVAPTPLTPELDPQPFLCMKSPSLPDAACGTLPAPAFRARAPWTLRQAHGFAAPMTLTLQGVIDDDGADNSLGFSVTNAIVLHVR